MCIIGITVPIIENVKEQAAKETRKTMKHKQQCLICGTSLGYKGLYRKCKSEQERREMLARTPEQIKKQQVLLQNIYALEDILVQKEISILSFVRSARSFLSAKELTKLANNWMTDDDADQNPEIDPITEEELT